MGNREINDDHASDLCHVQEVRDVVDRLRRLYAAAFDANQVKEATYDYEAPTFQSAPGR